MTDLAQPEMKIESWGDDPAGAFNHFLCHNGVALALDPSAAGVVLPPHLRERPHVVLQYELEPVVPIPDLEVTDEGVRATLSFGREPFATFVPWGAVLAMGPMHAARVEAPPKRAKLRAV
jgi:hypothetical protein